MTTSPGHYFDGGFARLRARFLHSPARRGMAALALSAALLGLANNGLEVILPLWVTKSLGWPPTQWALLRSTRFGAVTFGVILLGACSDRFGPVRITRYCALVMGVAMALMGVCGTAGLWVLLPLYGILASTIFVNLNTLVQDVSARRQGTANAIYRGFGMAAGIVAPFLATTLAAWWGRYPPVLVALAMVFFIKFFVLRSVAADPAAPPLRPLGEELRQLWATYRTALAERHLMRYIHFSLIWANLTAAVGAFAAIRFTQELHFSDRQFGVLCSTSGLLNLTIITLSILFMDRLALRSVMAVTAVLTGLGCTLMGLNNAPSVSVTGYVLHAAATSLFLSPMSIWVGRAAGAASRTAAFSVHKVAAGLYLSLAMLLVGLCERLFGMRLVLLGSGLTALISAPGFLLLREPPRTDPTAEEPARDVSPAA